MNLVTAAAAASFSIVSPAYAPLEMHPAVPMQLVPDRMVVAGRTDLSDNKPEAIQGPSPIMASWVGRVQGRIDNSTLPQGRDADNDGRWLKPKIAAAANAFFRVASDVLPGEPFIYSSLDGDLVAEFRGMHGTMTGILSEAFIVLYTVVDGTPVANEISLIDQKAADLRPVLQHLTHWLRTGQNGAMDTKR